MNRTIIYELACFMRRLEEDRTVKIAFENLQNIYGMVYRGKNDRYLMIINSNLSHEKQLETIWHESKHLHSHMVHKGDIKIIEKEAIEFSKHALELSDEILPACKSAW